MFFGELSKGEHGRGTPGRYYKDQLKQQLAQLTTKTGRRSHQTGLSGGQPPNT